MAPDIAHHHDLSLGELRRQVNRVVGGAAAVFDFADFFERLTRDRAVEFAGRASLEALLRLTTRGRERIRSPGGAIFLPVVEAGKRNFKGTFTARVSALLSTIR